ncbi:MAG: FtsX-like permease family protein [Eubacteriales bacterium]|nr:FtsX-like permease family protein [Eubacteriales bacterium]
MLSKLALRNAKRSMRDYSIYLLTVTIAFSLIYAFNMIVFSNDIQSLNRIMGSLPFAIVFISIIVIAVIEWLVHYMNRFMLEKRSKELGTYMLLGISNRKISKMVMVENMIMGAAALIAGLIAGTFLYEILTMVVMNVFDVRYTVKVGFSLPAVLLTVFYAILIYAFSMIRMRKRLKKVKICDLIYAEKQNETAVISNKKDHWTLCVVSTALIVSGCALLYITFHNRDFFSPVFLLVAFVLIIGGLYGVYITLAAFLVKVFLGKNERKYSKDNLFIYRNLSAKLKTMSITIGTLAMLLTLTLTCLQSAMLFNQFFELSALNRTSFDVQISTKDTSLFADAEKYFRDTRGIAESKQLPIYSCGQDTLIHTLGVDTYAETDYAISYSDYSSIRKIMGYDPVNLDETHYILHSYAEYKRVADAKGNMPYTINGVTLTLQNTDDSPLSLSGNIGVGYIIVLPDEIAAGLEVDYTTLVIDTKEETTVEDQKYLDVLYEENPEIDSLTTVEWDTKGSAISDSKASIILLGFCLYYTGLIFICTAATILTVQQLSEASKHRFRYKILSKLGVEDKKISRLVFRQLLLYFGVPLLLPVPLSIFISSCIRNLIMSLITPAVFWSSIAVGLGIFLLIYILYFAATFVGYKRSVL